MTSEIEKRVYRPAEFCRAFGLGKSKLYELIGRGEINAVKSGGSTIITADEATRWLSSLPPVVTGKNPATPSQQPA